MQTGPEKQMISMLEEAVELSGNFQKRTYEPAFRGFYERRRGALSRFCSQIREAEREQKEILIMQAAQSIPDYVLGKVQEIPGKRKQKIRIADYSFGLVTFLIPLLLFGREPELEDLAEQTVEKWNSLALVDMKIEKASFEEINGGFRNRLCYVTTAVCRSLNKPDECYELRTLREYRDKYLALSPGGRGTIQEYYNIAPTIVKRIERLDNADEVYEKIWQTYLKPCIGLIEQGELEACRKLYTNMIYQLEQEYLYSRASQKIQEEQRYE